MFERDGGGRAGIDAQGGIGCRSADEGASSQHRRLQAGGI
jgi:hypothetical protein